MKIYHIIYKIGEMDRRDEESKVELEAVRAQLAACEERCKLLGI